MKARRPRPMDGDLRHDGRLTRRHALALGAAAGAASLLRGGLQPAEALAAPRGLGLTVGPEHFVRGRTAALRAPARFVLVGVRDLPALGTELQVRARRARGAWGPWVGLHAGAGHRPDGARPPRASEPVWTGSADELQLRAARRPRRPVRLALVALPAGARALLGARSASAEARAAQVAGRPPIIPRSAWGAGSVPPRSAPAYGAVEAGFVHHTESANAYGPDQSAAIVLAIAKFHRDTRGWNDVGYNFLVDRFGRIFEGRAGGVELPVVGAHAQGFNSRSTGVSIIGSFTSESAPAAAVNAVSRLLAWKLPLHGAPVLGQVEVLGRRLQRINGHRDVNATTCPGNFLYGQLPDIRRRAGAAAPEPDRRPEVTLAARTAARYGSPVTFRGKVVSADKTPQPGVPVRLEKQGASGAWIRVAQTASGPDGTFSATVAWRRGGLVRAVALQTISLPVSVALVPVLEARADRTTVALGGRVTVSGTVRPSARVTIALERRVRGRWRRVLARRVSARRGVFRASLRPATRGTHRIVARTSVRGRKVAARPLAVKVTAPPGGLSA